MSTNISRRSIAKGAAWATPAVLATAAVPAYAASTTTPTEPTPEQIELRKRGVRGVFTAKIECNWIKDSNGEKQWTSAKAVRFIGNGVPYPTGGYYVEGVERDTKIENATVTVYVEEPWGANLSWIPTAQNSGWEVIPAGPEVPAKAGYSAYQIVYVANNWLYDEANKRYYTEDQPFFDADLSTLSCPTSGLKLFAMRSATVDGVVYNTAVAGPISLVPEFPPGA